MASHRTGGWSHDRVCGSYWSKRPVGLQPRRRAPDIRGMKNASGGTHLGAWLPHLSTPVAAVGFWLMHRADLLGPAPFWVILAMLAGSGVCNVVAYSISRRMAPSAARMHVRLSVAALTTTVILYSTGWGPVIAMGYVLGASDVLRTDGSEA